MRPFASPSRTALAAAALLALSTALPAAAQRSDAEWLEHCREQRNGRRAMHCEVRTESFRSTGTLTVDGGPNGGATVRGYDGDEVRVSARIQAHASTEEEARALARQVAVRASGGTVRAEGPDSRRGSGWHVIYDIQVPRRQNVSVTTNNGPVAVEAVSGRMALRTRNGPVSLRRVSGDVNARVSNGPISVVLDGARWSGEGLDVESTNGPVSLTIPENYSAELEVGTTHGPVDIDLPLSEGYRSGKRIRTRLGAGGPPVRVVTTNGPVTVQRSSR